MWPENYHLVHHPPSYEYELYFGPNHPGIEGNYALRVRLKGDEVQAVEADGGYLHHGFEKLIEERLWIQNVTLVPRIYAPDPVADGGNLCPRRRNVRGPEGTGAGAVDPGHGSGDVTDCRSSVHGGRSSRGHPRALHQHVLGRSLARSAARPFRGTDQRPHLPHAHHNARRRASRSSRWLSGPAGSGPGFVHRLRHVRCHTRQPCHPHGHHP